MLTAPRIQAVSTHVLVVIADPPWTHPLPDLGELEIGRDPGCRLQLADPAVSRRHAAVAVTPDGFTVRDLGSTHGTFVGSTRIGTTPQPLAAGQVIRIGDTALVVEAVQPRPRRPGIAGAMDHALSLVDRIARGQISVLILGETGVGKEVMAELVHRRSTRASGPFLRLNCAALSETLLESELFGYEKGAFTGASATKLGLLESASGGTVFLDEVGELPMATQVKLLRVLEQREVMRVGALAPRAIDVRFLAATHRDLPAEIAAGRFRQDLYFRLNGMSLRIPPLRERASELDALIDLFVQRVAVSVGRLPLPVTAAARAALRDHSWPGNIRELRNVIERAVLLADDEIGVEQVVLETAVAETTKPAGERERIVAALARAAGNQKLAAEILGISRRALLNKLDAYAIPRPRKLLAVR